MLKMASTPLTAFVKSEQILDVISVAKYYQLRPSRLMAIDEKDEYAAYCFDVACAYISQRVQNGDEPAFEKKKVKYGSFASLYKAYS